MKQEGQYIHVHIPKWYALLLLGTFIVGLLALAISLLITLIARMPFQFAGANLVLETGVVIAYTCTMITSGMVIIAFAFFPKSTRPKSDPRYRSWKLWE